LSGPAEKNRIDIGKKFKSVILVLLFVNFIGFIYFILRPWINRLPMVLESSVGMFNLLFFDLFLLILALLAIIFIAFLVLVKLSPRIGAGSKNGISPISVSLLFPSGCFVLLVFTPTVISDHLAYIVEPSISIWPHPNYILSVFICCLGIAIYLVFSALKSNWARYATLTLVILFPLSFLFPLGWLVAAQKWTGIKNWRFLLPVFLGLTCTIPLIHFPESQPIRLMDFSHGLGDKGYQLFRGSHISEPEYLKGQSCIGYQAKFDADNNALYARCHASLFRFDLDSNDDWKMGNTIDLSFNWDQASFDFDRQKGYVFDGINGQLNLIDLKRFGLVEKIKVESSQADMDSHFINQAIETRRNRLAICVVDGRHFTMELGTIYVLVITSLPKA